MKNIWLIRHGECGSNTGEMTTHPGASTLTHKGMMQSRCIASFINHRPDIIIHSPFIRTLQSARMTMDKFPDVTVEEWPVQEFIYLPHEKYKHTTQADRQVAVSEYWRQNKPALKTSVEAESFIEFIDRMQCLVEKLVSTKGHVIVFTHGHVIRAMIWKVITGVLKDDETAMLRYRSLRQALRIPNAAILKISLDEQELQMSQLITTHLAQLL
jgi:2,3-bisphosphoglycerate-dependent phosphoglycerate mutase